MIVAVDVSYREKSAVVAGVIFSGWGDDAPERVVTSSIDIPADYQPGQFYKRELPCILKLLREHELQPDCIVIDGFVYLDGHSTPGLGRHLYDALGGKVMVIGVAKSPFRGIGAECRILRGTSERPLYVTAAGVHLDLAKNWIRSMHGKHRLPTLLKKADEVARSYGESEEPAPPAAM